MINMFSIIKVFLFATLITIIFANAAPNEGLFNSFGQQTPQTPVQFNSLPYFPTTTQSWPLRNQPPIYTNQLNFPTTQTVFPTAQTVFPTAQTVFPTAQTVFPSAQTVYPTSQTAFNSVKPMFPLAQLQQITQGFQSPSMNQNQRSVFLPYYAKLSQPPVFSHLISMLNKSLNANNNVIQTPTVSPYSNQQQQLYNQLLQYYNFQHPQAQVQPNIQEEILKHQQQATEQQRVIDGRKIRRQIEEEIKRREQLFKLHEKEFREELENKPNLNEETEQETSEVQEEKEKENNKIEENKKEEKEKEQKEIEEKKKEEKEKEDREKEEEKRVEDIHKLLHEKMLPKNKRIKQARLQINKLDNKKINSGKPISSQNQQPNQIKKKIRRPINSKPIPTSLVPKEKNNSLVLEN